MLLYVRKSRVTRVVEPSSRGKRRKSPPSGRNRLESLWDLVLGTRCDEGLRTGCLYSSLTNNKFYESNPPLNTGSSSVGHGLETKDPGGTSTDELSKETT